MWLPANDSTGKKKRSLVLFWLETLPQMVNLYTHYETCKTNWILANTLLCFKNRVWSSSQWPAKAAPMAEIQLSRSKACWHIISPAGIPRKEIKQTFLDYCIFVAGISASTEPICVWFQPFEGTERWHSRWWDPGKSVCILRRPSPDGTSLGATWKQIHNFL